jgi:hypothetical protein
MSRKKEVIFNVIGDLVDEAIRLAGLEGSIDVDDPAFIEFLEAKLCEVLNLGCFAEGYEDDLEKALKGCREESEDKLKELLLVWVKAFPMIKRIEEDWEKAKRQRKGLTKEEEELLYG